MIRRRTPLAVLLAFLALLLSLLVGSGSAGGQAGAETSPKTSPEAGRETRREAGPVETVIAVSIDGLNPRAITRLGRKGAPGLHRLIRTGTTTLNARTAHELTDTLPNHVGMVSGRRIEAATGGHGVTWNDNRLTPATVQQAAGGPVASVFEVADEAGGDPAYFASKTKFSLWQRSWPGAIDEAVIVEDDRALTTRLLGDLGSTTRNLRFLHLSGPDKAGHATGFMSPRYLRAVRGADRQLRRLIRGVNASPALRGHTAIVLTSDHGGRGRSHRNPARPVNYTVPFMVWGPGVARGADLYALNPARTDPKRSRTTYAEAPVRNADVANLALDLLELSAVPGSELNASQDLDWVELTTQRAAATD